MKGGTFSFPVAGWQPNMVATKDWCLTLYT